MRRTIGKDAPRLFATMTAKGKRAPVQKAAPTPWMKTAGRVSHCGSAALPCPLSARAAPAPERLRSASDRDRRQSRVALQAHSSAENGRRGAQTE